MLLNVADTATTVLHAGIWDFTHEPKICMPLTYRISSCPVRRQQARHVNVRLQLINVQHAVPVMLADN